MALGRRACQLSGIRGRALAAVTLAFGILGCGSGSQSSGNGAPAADSGGSPSDSSVGASGSSGSGGGGQSRPDGSIPADGAADASGADQNAANVPDARADAVPPASDAGQDAGDAGTVALPARVLLYYLGAIPAIPMQSVLAQLAFYTNTLKGWNFASDETIDPSTITDANLTQYAALAMVNTCFSPFGQNKPDTPQSQVIQRFLQRGGGLFGTHCADVTFQSAMPPVLYNQLIGGRGGNGFFEGQNSCRKLADHPSTAQLPAMFPFMGNLDNTDFLAPDSTVLVRCTWITPNGKDVAVSWYRNEGLGRVFYTDFAKVDTDLTDPVIGASHVVPGLSWVLRR